MVLDGMEEKEVVINLYDQNQKRLWQGVAKVTAASAKLDAELFGNNGIATKRNLETIIVRLTTRKLLRSGYIEIPKKEGPQVFSIVKNIPVSGASSFYAVEINEKWAPKDG